MTGLHLKLIRTGETLNIPQPEGRAPDPGNWWPNGWFPDSTKFVATRTEGGVSAWVISVMGGPPRKLRDDADIWSVSPDGTLITFGTGVAFIRFREIWLMGAQGEEPRRFISGSQDDGFFGAQWSPDGKRIAFGKYHRTPDKLECSIESRDLGGGHPTVILSDPGLCKGDIMFWWSPTGRIVYINPLAEGYRLSANLWELQVDTKTGEPLGKPKRLTNWSEVFLRNLSGTSDGKQLAVTKLNFYTYVSVGEIEAGDHRLKESRRLALEESSDSPGGWMPDSKAVLFWSDRNETWGIYEQALDQTTPQTITTGPDYKAWPVVSPDGAWILYLSDPGGSAPKRIMRVPTSGGGPQSVLEGRKLQRLACARSPRALCVFAEEAPDRKQLIFSAFDPVKGRGEVLTRVDLKKPGGDYFWDLSADGSRLAFAQLDEDAGRIRILPLTSGEARELNVKGWKNLETVFWAADGRGVFVSPIAGMGQTELYVDLEGRAQVIWHQGGGSWIDQYTLATPSPNGRYLAVSSNITDANIWLLEGFQEP